MRSRSLLAAPLGLALLAGLSAACTTTETQEKKSIVYDAYQGDPVFPNRRPKLALPDGDIGVTSDNGSDTVTLLDLVTNQVIGSGPVGRDPVDNDGPHHVAADRKAGFLYVALAYPPPTVASGPHSAHGSSTRSGFIQKLALDDLRILGEVRIDTNPGDIVMSEDGKLVVVSHFDLKKALESDGGVEQKRATLAFAKTDEILAEGSPDATRITTCVAPHGIALSRPDGKTVYAACYGEDAVAVVDLTDPSATPKLVPVGAGVGTVGSPAYGPYAVVLNHAGTKLAVSSTESRDVRFFDVATGTMDPLIIVTQGAPYFVAFSEDDQTIFIPTQSPDAVVVANAQTGEQTGFQSFDAATCQLPHEVALSSDYKMLYVACEGDHKAGHVKPSVVLGLDPSSLAKKATMPVGAYPDRILVVKKP